MRHIGAIVLIILLLQTVTAIEKIDELVIDEAGIIDNKSEIKGVLQNLYDTGVAEFAVITVRSLEGKPIDDYAFDVANNVLGDKEKDNGLLLLVALDDRKWRIEVGRGLEAELPDGKVGTIGRQYLVENFQNEEYGKGIYETVNAINAVLTDDVESEYYIEEKEIEPNTTVIIFALLFVFLTFILPIIIVSLAIFGKRKGKNGKRDPNDYFIAAAVLGSMFGRGGFGGIGGSSGGFGGFGGGSFGGGGAGGGW